MREYGYNGSFEEKYDEETFNKKLLLCETVIGYTSAVNFLIILFVASYGPFGTALKIALIAAGSLIFIVGTAAAVKIERDAGYYECPECGKRYKPTLKSVLWAPHIGRSRKMKCPFCGARRYHKKVLTK